MSPGTISLEGISTFLPFLYTLALGADKAFKLSKDCSALKCCTVPNIALRIITAKITKVLSKLPVIAEIIAAAIKINTNKSLN